MDMQDETKIPQEDNVKKEEMDEFNTSDNEKVMSEQEERESIPNIEINKDIVEEEIVLKEENTVAVTENLVTVEEENFETEETINMEENISEVMPSIAEHFDGVDFSDFSQQKMVATLRLLVDEKNITAVKDTIDRLQATFYRDFNKDKKVALDEFIAKGNSEEDFEYTTPYEQQFRSLLNKYRERKNEQNKMLEEEKSENLRRKYEVIERIKNLINKQESLSETFKEFNTLQEEWNSIGFVPQSKVNQMWSNYHHHVENFYDYIRINKELRDLDFKKNLEIKEKILQRAKELSEDKNVRKAFVELQKLHEKWKEAGPVKRELREELWGQFKGASKLIHKNHQDYFVSLKNEQKENLQRKEELCEKVEALVESLPDSNKQWNRVGVQIKELQEAWKTVGFAPRKSNQAVYDRFRKACDKFFHAKREIHKQQSKEFKENLDKKVLLCEKAEAVMDSEDWKEITEYLIGLQKEWKEIGAVQYKHSQKVWDRFRTACDRFFDRRSGKIQAISEQQQEENLAQKQEIIDEIQKIDLKDDDKEALKQLQKLQTAYHSAGYVPIEEKDSINESFKKALDAKFDKLDISEEQMEMQKFIGKYTAMLQESDGEGRVVKERSKLATQVKQIENNIVVWSNNIGFFSNSSNAEKLIADVEKNILEAKEELKGYYKKIRFLDKLLQ